MKTVASHSRAFTLVELLTVVAIIGVLAAIIIPVVGSARASARASGCLANLRQIAVAGQLYANENQRRLVPIARGTGASDARTWRYYLAPYLSQQADGIDPVGVFTCPTDKAESPTLTSHARGLRPLSYGVTFRQGQNFHEYLTDGGSRPSIQMSALLRPSRTIFVTDLARVSNPGAAPADWTATVSSTANSFGYARFPGDSNFTGGDTWNIFPRHRGKANVAFYDGSTRAVDVQKDIIEKPAGHPACLFTNTH